MATSNSSAQRSFAAEPYDSVAAVLASKQITSDLVGQVIKAKTGEAWVVADSSATVFSIETAGGAKLVALTQPSGATPYSAFATPSSRTLDNTAKINAAIAANQEVTIPPGDWRVDGTVQIYGGKTLTFARGARLTKLIANTSDTAPALQQRGSYTKVHGARIYQTTNSPDGAYRIGARGEDDAAEDHLWWESLYPEVQAAGLAGSRALVLDSSQWKAGGKANYFGHIMRPFLRGADVLLWLREICNAHTIIDPQFYHPKDFALLMEGAYANNIHGGFVHTAAAGSTSLYGIGLKQRTRGSSHHSTENTIIGMGIEPGLPTTRGILVETGCVGNTVLVKANIAAASTLQELQQNIIDGRYGQYEFGRNVRFNNNVSVPGNRLMGRELHKVRPRQDGLTENLAVDLFEVFCPAQSELVLTVKLTARSPALDRGSAIEAKYRISRAGTGVAAVVGAAGGYSDGNAGTLSVEVDGTGGRVVVRWTTANNWSATNNAWVAAEASLLLSEDVPVISSTALSVL